jgi:hypothetical protein
MCFIINIFFKIIQRLARYDIVDLIGLKTTWIYNR